MKKKLIVLFMILFSKILLAQQSSIQNEVELDQKLLIEDEMGVNHSLREFSAHSFLLVPVYTKCRSTCPLIIKKLEHDLPLSGADINNYRVLIFSFDSQDSSKDLKHFREMHQIPPLWMIARATPLTTTKILQTLGIRTVLDPVTQEFAHPDVVSILGPGLWGNKLLNGSDISPATLKAELLSANQHKNGISKEMLGYLLPIGILGILFSVFFFSNRWVRAS